MTNTEQILWAFQRNGYKMTLGYMLQHPWGYKAASRMADLRKKGYQIVCHKAENPSDNLYVMTHFDKQGQGSLGI
jgi:hypothetical protein